MDDIMRAIGDVWMTPRKAAAILASMDIVSHVRARDHSETVYRRI